MAPVTHTARRRAGALGALVLSLSGVSSCSAPADPREVVVASVLEQADDAFIRARPVLVAGKYATMSVPGISFFRGVLPLYVYDFENGFGGLTPSSFAIQDPLVPCVGDPHPENFGTLLASDGTVALELDDFDTADRAPYLFDVRRFTAGMALAAHLANSGDAAANALTAAAATSIARAGALGYVEGIQAAAEGHAPGRVVFPTSAPSSAYLDSLLMKAQTNADDRDELTTETVDAPSGRRLVRGVLDPDDPQNVWENLPDFALSTIQATLDGYRLTLVNPPPPAYFTVKDAVREFGAGVASWPKLRAIVLVEGATESASDDELLEVKELSDSGIAGLYGPGVYADDVVDRDILVSRAAWARPDADFLWGGSTWEGFNVQVRHESAAAKGVKVDDLTGEFGTVQALTDMAEQLGRILARLHAAPMNGQPSAASTIWAVISTDTNGFLDEQATVGEAYAEQSLADLPRFQTALQQLGTRLGCPLDPGDAPPPDEALLLGTPPTPLAPTLPPSSSP